MMAPHCLEDMAPVPESVSQSISTSSARSLKTLSLASSSRRSRSAREVMRMGSTLLMRKGSIRVLGMCAPGLSWSGAQSYHREKTHGVGYFQRPPKNFGPCLHRGQRPKNQDQNPPKSSQILRKQLSIV